MKMKTVIIRLTPEQAEELAALASLTDRSKVGAVRYAVRMTLTSLRVYSALNGKSSAPGIDNNKPA